MKKILISLGIILVIIVGVAYYSNSSANAAMPEAGDSEDLSGVISYFFAFGNQLNS